MTYVYMTIVKSQINKKTILYNTSATCTNFVLFSFEQLSGKHLIYYLINSYFFSYRYCINSHWLSLLNNVLI